MQQLPATLDLELPRSATTLAGFRQWRAGLGEDAPTVHFIEGDLFFEMTPQDFHTHLAVVTEVNRVLANLTRESDLGRYFADGGWVTHAAAGISNQPDGFLVRWASFEEGLAVLEGQPPAIELAGRPDLVLEVVSPSSVRKDTERLRDRYAAAGVSEYWLIDARSGMPAFDLLVLTPAGTYEPQPAGPDGFVPSPTWGRAFRLRREDDRLGQPDYRLDLR